MSEALKTNKGLEKLNLQGIFLDTTAIQSISDAIQRNQTLVQLLIDIDNASKDGVCSIIRVMTKYR